MPNDEVVILSGNKTDIIEDKGPNTEVLDTSVKYDIEFSIESAEILEKVYNTTILDSPVNTEIISNITSETIEVFEKCSVGAGTTQTAVDQGIIFVTDVVPNTTGIVGNKSWVSKDIPAESDILSCVSNTSSVQVHVWVEGGTTKFTPQATVDGIEVTNLVQHPSNIRVYTGYVVVDVPATRTVEVASSTGGSDSVLIQRAAEGPAVTDVIFGPYPGAQTALKAGDTISVTVNTGPTATSVTIFPGGANSSALTLPVANGVATGNITASSLSGLQGVSVSAVDSFGTVGSTLNSANKVLMDQVYPSIGAISIAYPNGQQALKNTESATVSAIVSNYDTVSYTLSSDLSTTNSLSVYRQNKTVSRANGNYIVTGSNYSILATRNANGATVTDSALIKIANVAPTAYVTIDGSPTRLVSSAAGNGYTVRLHPSQQLLNTPSMDATLGSFSPSFAGSYYKTLTIDDTVAKGTGYFNNLLITGLSGLTSSTITSGDTYIVGGFDWRTITFDPFTQYMPIGTNIGIIANTQVRLTGTVDYFILQSNTAFNAQGYTISDAAGAYSATGSHLLINNSDLTGANVTGTLKFDIRETA